MKRFVLAGALFALVLSGCQDETMGFSTQEVFSGAYKRNFEQKIGAISPNQSWDFSSHGRALSAAITRAREDYVPVADEDEYYYVENETLKWMKEQLPESTNNNSKTKPFNLVWEEGTVFEIIPIYQGQAGLDWDLHMVINGVDKKLWSKSTGVEILQDCQNCKGTGKIADYCHTCDGKKTVSCSNENCHEYNGTYYVPASSLLQIFNMTVCPAGSSNGAQCYLCGKVHTDKKSDKQNKSAYVVKCPTCGGDGLITCTTCNGTGLSGEATATCSECNGEGHQWHAITTTENTTSANAVRSKTVDIRDFFDGEIPNGATISFYLQITKVGNNASKYGKVGDKLTSEGGKISILNCPTPTNIGPGYTTYILGCEDSSTSSSDSDFNDVVFLLAGYIPPVVYEDGTSVETISKRYMIEDLTSVGDFDFNDIVVDVIQTTTTWYKINTETNLMEPDPAHPTPVTEQTATVRWLCGTVPIQVQVGNTVFGKVTAPVEEDQSAMQLMGITVANPVENSMKYNPGYQPLYNNATVTKVIDGNSWDPVSNNISVTVWWDGTQVTTNGSNETWLNKFPERGTIPFMVATDIYNQPNWTDEGEDITETTWWKANYIATQKK